MAIVDNIHSLKRQLKYVPQTIRLVYQASKHYFIIWFFLLIIQGVLPAVIVYLTAPLVDGIAQLIKSGGSRDMLYGIVPLAVAMGAAVLIKEVSGSVLVWVRTVQSEHVRDAIHERIHAKAIALPLKFYEDPSYYDMLHRARVDALNKPTELLENFGTLLSNTITFVSMLLIVATFAWWLPLVLVFSLSPALYIVFKYVIAHDRYRIRNTMNTRQTHYLDWILTERSAAMELRIFNLGRFFKHRFQSLRSTLRAELLAIARSEMLAKIATRMFAVLVAALIFLWVILQAFQGRVTLGGVAMFYQAFNQSQKLLQTLLSSIGSVYKNILFIENFFEFLELDEGREEGVSKTPFTLEKSIRFEAVDFAYPNVAHRALKNFSIEFQAGKITAIVGSNGAGKSTLVKLLSRFYEPQNGNIYLDDKPLSMIGGDELRRNITFMFQHPMEYSDSVRANLAFADIEQKYSDDALMDAAKVAGTDHLIKGFAKGLDTQLGRWFGEVELSTGEWQRLALSRTFLKQAKIIILDEPTSAMDSWAETEWLQKFKVLAEEHTVIIITHRLTTAMHADQIYVMDDGSVVESGTHDSLLEQQGMYADSWTRQTQLNFVSG